ncbi:MAG: NAD-dependent epimerase/dehydratase family protein, partial [Planctomycetota bacterium]
MTSKAVWITGAGGFVGGWLLKSLAAAGRPAAALVRKRVCKRLEVPSTPLDLVKAALAAPGDGVADLGSLPEPGALIHLAALSHPGDCERNPQRARLVNGVGVARLFDQCFRRWPELPILFVSSGQVYRPGPEPLGEAAPVEPRNVYAATKLHGEAVALGFRDRGHPALVVRPFNHSGPGQAARFALPSFALRLARLEKEGGGWLAVGNLAAVRDFLHVRQVVDAYLDLLPHAGEADVVNVCSGQGVRIGELLEGLVARTRA